MKHQAKDYIKRFNLKPHPEGGYYARSYESDIILEQPCLPACFDGKRFLSTAIYYLLEQGDFSAFHRLKGDECWHFYAGEPLYLFIIENDGNLQQIVLGNNVPENEIPQFVVKAGKWFAAVPCENSTFSFAGCTVTPGFDFEDLEFANKEALINQYPSLKTIIEIFTR